MTADATTSERSPAEVAAVARAEGAHTDEQGVLQFFLERHPAQSGQVTS